MVREPASRAGPRSLAIENHKFLTIRGRIAGLDRIAVRRGRDTAKTAGRDFAKPECPKQIGNFSKKHFYGFTREDPRA
jgi:hypothetical protein